MAAKDAEDPEAINALKNALKNLESDKRKVMRMDEIAFANLRLYLSAWHRHEPGA